VLDEGGGLEGGEGGGLEGGEGGGLEGGGTEGMAWSCNRPNRR